MKKKSMVHEVPCPGSFFREVWRTLRRGAQLLVAEPKGHVSGEAFEKTLAVANEQGFILAGRPSVPRSHSALLRKA
jgi:hypothetical protein